jgi:hypothetical protein
MNSLGRCLPQLSPALAIRVGRVSYRARPTRASIPVARSFVLLAGYLGWLVHNCEFSHRWRQMCKCVRLALAGFLLK